jgi:hypothetical protein
MDILRKYPTGYGTQWHVLDLDDRHEPSLDPLQRLGNCHRRAVVKETFVAQRDHRGRPS